jgi:DNA invertase Pin-like site-specific DNA recombinase
MQWRRPLTALAAAALTLLMSQPAVADDPPAAAGWHGREIRDPLPPRGAEATTRFPRGWSAGAVARGTGYTRASGSRRVREVQRQLVRRGYRPGPVDGRFGPRTRAAVMWFQTKHGLARTGRIGAVDIATLRRRARFEATRNTADAPRPVDVFGAPPMAAAPERDDPLWILLALVMLLGLAVIAWWLRTELRREPEPAPAEEPRRRVAAVPPAAPAPKQVVGYVAVPLGPDRERDLDTAARLIGTWCEGRGWPLARVVHDVTPATARVTDRPGLAHVLDQIAEGRVAGLVVARLSDVTGSVSELAKLLRWIDTADAFLIALDSELDTTTPAGELAANALVHIGEWERDRIATRTHPGLTAIRSPGSAPPASVRDHPELIARINAMRARGMSLQAISDALNADGVPTLRGGTKWRPSSVQTATGYKRPNPPARRWDNNPV